LSRSARCDNPNSAKADYGRIFLLQDIQALQITDGLKNLEGTQPATDFLCLIMNILRKYLRSEKEQRGNEEMTAFENREEIRWDGGILYDSRRCKYMYPQRHLLLRRSMAPELANYVLYRRSQYHRLGLWHSWSWVASSSHEIFYFPLLSHLSCSTAGMWSGCGIPW
jgi:hypothetical protein